MSSLNEITDVETQTTAKYTMHSMIGFNIQAKITAWLMASNPIFSRTLIKFSSRPYKPTKSSSTTGFKYSQYLRQIS